jgi:hypothetical protein
MIVTDTSGYILKAELLRGISEYDIFKKYLGYDFKPHRNYLSPFRDEMKPSFGMFVTKEGHLFFKDFGGDGYGGDCIKFVALLFKISYFDAIQKIKADFNFHIGTPPERQQHTTVNSTPKPFTRIQIIAKSFLKEELKYWNQYGIDISDLKRENIFSVSQLFISKKKVPIGKSLVFAYFYQDHGNEYLKIYQPFEKLHKWYSNVPVKKPLLLDRLEHKSTAVTLAKSKKDKIVLNKVITDVYETQKEGKEVVPEELNNFFDEYYENKYVFFDNDVAGIKAANSLKPFGFHSIYIPVEFNQEGIKDPSDLVLKYGFKALEKLIQCYELPMRMITW